MRSFLNQYSTRCYVENLRVILLVALCILSIEPYFIWPYRQYIYIVALPLFLFSMPLIKGYLPVASVLGIFFVFYFLDLSRLYTFYSTMAFQIYFLFFLPIFSQWEMGKVYKLTVSAIAIIYLLGIPFYLIDRVLGLPFFVIPERVPDNGILGYKCYVFFVQAVNDIDLYPRFRSVFDEAGVVGTTSLILLTGNKYRLNNWRYVIIFFAGLISMSFFFYLGSLVIFTLFNIKRVKMVLVGIIVIVVGYLMVRDNNIFEALIIERVELTDNKLAGDNRTSLEWDYEYKKFMKSGAKYTGNGMESFNNIDFPSVASYQTFIYEYGMIGALLIIMYFLLLIFRSTGHYGDKLIVLIAFLLVFYQRPWVFDFHNAILFYAICSNFDGKSYYLKIVNGTPGYKLSL